MEEQRITSQRVLYAGNEKDVQGASKETFGRSTMTEKRSSRSMNPKDIRGAALAYKEAMRAGISPPQKVVNILASSGADAGRLQSAAFNELSTK